MHAVKGGVGDDACRRREGEQRIHRIGHLGGTGIAMVHHAVDPAPAGRAAMDEAAHFLEEAAQLRRLRIGEVRMVERRLGAEGFERGGKAALVGREGDIVENVDLAMVLTMDMGVGAGDALGKGGRSGIALDASAVGMGAGGKIIASEVFGAVCPRRRARCGQ